MVFGPLLSSTKAERLFFVFSKRVLGVKVNECRTNKSEQAVPRRYDPAGGFATENI